MVSRRSGDGPRKQRSGLFSNSGQSPVAMRSRATAGRCPASTAMAAPPCAACELAGQGRFPGNGKYREPHGIVSIFRKKFIGLGRIVSVPNRSRAGGCAPMVPAGSRRRISGSECCIRRMEPPRQGGVRRLPENPGAGHSGPSRATHAKSCSTSFFCLFSRMASPAAKVLHNRNYVKSAGEGASRALGPCTRERCCRGARIGTREGSA